ncbi:MAG: CRISPR type III-B/RAMP module-associated protein Cmr5 [Xylanivirga thermophila]|jgi:hypothetical protein|uniref:hypothetical protein n=1 Tax=Xylanivirga thermophila TaxID=2496273 RepID=UPI0039F4AB17
MAVNKNLDAAINSFSYDMVKKMVENKKYKQKLLNNIEKALGVLTNDGVYAYYVFCKSQIDKENKDNPEKDPMFQIYIMNIVKEFQTFVKHKLNDKGYDAFFCKLSEDIHDLLFFKDIIEQVLIYARYHAKACGDEND